MKSRPLSEIVQVLNSWLKPTVFAQSWDKVGLILGGGPDVEEDEGRGSKLVSKIMVCHDLLPEVLEEAVSKGVQLIVCYHTIMINPKGNSWMESITTRCKDEGISVYSPHTALDAIAGGINDKVVEGVLEHLGLLNNILTSVEVRAIMPSNFLPGWKSASLSISAPLNNISAFLGMEEVQKRLTKVGMEVINDDPNSEGKAEVRLYSKKWKSKELVEMQELAQELGHFIVSEDHPPRVFGAGRLLIFKHPVEFPTLVETIKKTLDLKYVQVSSSNHGKPITSTAICTGSGVSFMKHVISSGVDVFITGELNYHSILDAQVHGISVILCGHQESESHYLPRLVSIIKLLTGIDEVFISTESGRSGSPLMLA